MKTKRVVIWGSAWVAAGAVLLLDVTNVFPDWLLGGPVALGIAGVAMLADRIACTPEKRNGFYLPLLLVGLSLGTVLQDAELLVDEYSIWPPLVGALALAFVLEAITRHTGPPRGLTAR